MTKRGQREDEERTKRGIDNKRPDTEGRLMDKRLTKKTDGIGQKTDGIGQKTDGIGQKTDEWTKDKDGRLTEVT